MAPIYDRLVKRLSIVLASTAGVCLLIIIVLVVGNGIIRNFYKPFAGIVEVVGWLTAVATSFALGYAQVNKKHVDIDMIVTKFPPIVKKSIELIILLVSLCFFIFVGFQIIFYGINLFQQGSISQTLRVTYYPIVFMVSVGFFGLTLALLIDFIKLLLGGVRHES